MAIDWSQIVDKEDDTGIVKYSRTWKVLIVDDEPAVHDLTRFVLADYLYEDIPLEFLSAYRTSQARDILADNPDVAMVFLDVVMETEDAGLELVRYIREDLNNHLLQIVLRTGQPGQAPEVEVFSKYEINDYKEKTELTASRLFSTVTSALRAYKLSRSLQDSVDLLEQRVKERTFELETANKELEAFTHTVSHELRAPLRSILGFSNILVEDHLDELSQDARENLARVINNAQKMDVLLTGLFELSRYSRKLPQRDRTDLHSLVTQVVDHMSQQIQKNGTTIEIGTLPVIEGDQILLKQVFSNLISNAIKFSSRSSNPLVKIGSCIQDGQIVMYVRDNGAGFDEAHSAKLFELFQRLHNQDEFEGSGVGLAIVERIINRHGGRIWAESKVGEGATFYFTLNESGS